MTIHAQTEATHLLIRFDQKFLSEPEAKKIVDTYKRQLEHPPMVVFDFSVVEDIAPMALRTLSRLLGPSSQADARMAFLVTDHVRKFIIQNGLDRIFPCYSSMSEIIGLTTSQSMKAQALEFLNTTLGAIGRTFDVALSATAKPGRSFISGSETMPVVDIGAMVGLVSTPFNGTLIIAFPMPTYLACMSRMIGTEYPEFVSEIRDGAAELLNMILGQAKISLNEKGFGIKQAIPTVAQGAGIKIFSGTAPSVIVPFTSDIGAFYVELATSSTGHKGSKSG